MRVLDLMASEGPPSFHGSSIAGVSFLLGLRDVHHVILVGELSVVHLCEYTYTPLPIGIGIILSFTYI